MSSLGARGALIVFEGCDRSGKTSTCQRFVKYLVDNLKRPDSYPSAQFHRFPDRKTKIGQVIDEYLQGQNQLDDHVIHLLFSTNRWEKSKEIIETLNKGTHVIIDRYAFSGVAYSASKEDLTLEWCKKPDSGLPRPDLVCFLEVSADEASKRGGFGDERYEKREFQDKVRLNYIRLMENDPSWKVVNTNGLDQDEVFEEVRSICMEVINRQKGPIEELWPM